MSITTTARKVRGQQKQGLSVLGAVVLMVVLLVPSRPAEAYGIPVADTAKAVQVVTTIVKFIDLIVEIHDLVQNGDKLKEMLNNELNHLVPTRAPEEQIKLAVEGSVSKFLKTVGSNIFTDFHRQQEKAADELIDKFLKLPESPSIDFDLELQRNRSAFKREAARRAMATAAFVLSKIPEAKDTLDEMMRRSQEASDLLSAMRVNTESRLSFNQMVVHMQRVISADIMLEAAIAMASAQPTAEAVLDSLIKPGAPGFLGEIGNAASALMSEFSDVSEASEDTMNFHNQCRKLNDDKRQYASIEDKIREHKKIKRQMKAVERAVTLMFLTPVYGPAAPARWDALESQIIALDTSEYMSPLRFLGAQSAGMVIHAALGYEMQLISAAAIASLNFPLAAAAQNLLPRVTQHVVTWHDLWKQEKEALKERQEAEEQLLELMISTHETIKELMPEVNVDALILGSFPSKGGGYPDVESLIDIANAVAQVKKIEKINDLKSDIDRLTTMEIPKTMDPQIVQDRVNEFNGIVQALALDPNCDAMITSNNYMLAPQNIAQAAMNGDLMDSLQEQVNALNPRPALEDPDEPTGVGPELMVGLDMMMGMPLFPFAL